MNNFLWRLIRPALFALDAEHAHELTLSMLARASRLGCVPRVPAVATAPQLARECFGLRFSNPLGLAAGCDKNAVALRAWQALGFGYVEVGTVTAHAQPGNPKPRVFRLPQDQALLNRLGFNNLGAVAVAKNIEQQRTHGGIHIPIGVNIGKSKVVSTERAAEDYLQSFAAVADVADYVAINISSPNTPGLRDLQEEEHLLRLLDALCDANARRSMPRPLLLKLAPDLDDGAASAAAKAAVEHKLAALIISNTTISRAGVSGPVPDGPGGISGAPLFARSTEMLRDLHAQFHGRIAFIGVGGIMNAADAQKKISSGADLLQMYTGLVYEGPYLVMRILREFASTHPAQ